MGVLLMALCGLLVLLGLAAVARWGHESVVPAPDDEAAAPRSVGLLARRYLRQVTIAVGAGVGSGLLVAGAGGRLAMRLLAVTAGDQAQGRLTEAEQAVGEITLGGTAGFVLFGALFFGVPAGVLYMLVRRWLPRGRASGPVFGGLLLVVGSTRIDPLRADNPDFGIVGPGWLALVVFGLLVVAHGALVAALAARYSRSLPLLPGRPVAYLPVLLLLPLVPAVVLAAAAGAVGVALARQPAVVRLVASRRTLVVGRVALGALALLALPSFVDAAELIART